MKRSYQAGRVIISAILLFSSIAGGWNGIHDLINAKLPGEILTGIFVILYFIGGITAVIGLWKNRFWSLLCIAIWSLGSFGAAFSATHFYGGQSILISLVAGCGVALIALPLYLVARKILKTNSIPVNQ